MKKNVTYVANDKIMQVVRESGAQIEEKKGWTKVSFSPAHRVYVPHTKNVGRIDVSGFEVTDALIVVSLKGESFGNVKQQLNMTLPEEQILANLKIVLESMKALPPAAKPPRKQPERKSEAKPIEAPVANPVDERKKKLLSRAQELIALRGLSIGEAITAAQAEMD